MSLELAEAYTRLDPTVIEYAVKGDWDKRHVTESINKAAEKAQAEKLRELVKKTDAVFIPTSKIGKLLPDDVTKKYTKIGGYSGTKVDATAAAIKKAMAKPEVVGLTIYKPYYEKPHLVLVGTEASAQWERPGLDGKTPSVDEKIEAKRARSDANEKHWEEFGQSITTKKILLAKAMNLALRTFIARLDFAEPACTLLGLVHSYSNSNDVLLAEFDKRSGPELATLLAVVTFAAGENAPYGEYGPDDLLVDQFAEVLGWAPLPEATDV